MKKLWWIFSVVFAIGVATGAVLDAAPAGGELPVFSRDMTEAPTKEPMPTAADLADEILPGKLQYTALEIQDLVSYDGPYLEDGTDETVENVAALVLHNTGTIGIEYAEIVVRQDGKELVFDATYIPPRGTVLILESSKAAYSDSPMEEYRCRTVIPGSFDQQSGQICVEASGMGEMTVKNLTDQSFSCVRIYYKQHDGESDTYIGGISFSAVIPNLLPGETRIIHPYHYAQGYAQIVAVVTQL